jgi:hypothetical protein
MPISTPPTRLRRFQFGLGTMLLLVALIAVAIFAAREHSERVRIQSRLEAELEMRNDPLFQALVRELDNIDFVIDNLSKQVKNNNNPAIKRAMQRRDTLERKIDERRARWLK